MIASKVKLPNVVIPRNVRLHYERFLDHFKGFENVDAVRGIFGLRTKSVLRALKVEFFSSKWGYMGVSDEDGHLVVSTHYLRTGTVGTSISTSCPSSSPSASSPKGSSSSRRGSIIPMHPPRSR